MKVLMSVCLSFFVITSIASAWSDESRLDKVRTLLEAQGLLVRLEAQSDMGKKQGAKMAHNMMQKMLSKLEPDAEFRAKLESAYVHFLSDLDQAGDKNDIVRVWSEEYAGQFSDEELDRLIAFYTSDLGKKHISTNEAALPGFTKKFSAAREPAYQKAMEGYIADMAKIAEECQCPKTK